MLQQEIYAKLVDLERKGSICIPNLDSLICKLSLLKIEGIEKLKVFTDFDQTLTRFWFDEGKTQHCFPTYRVLEESNLLPDWYRKGTKELLDKYYVIEIEETRYIYLLAFRILIGLKISGMIGRIV